MKAVIVNCFDTYEDRVDLVHEFFCDKGYDATVIQSNFRHFKKVFRKDKKDGFKFIEVNAYNKNLSVSRMASHHKFAKDAFIAVEEINPDIIYVLLPPNSSAKFAAKYKRKHKEVKLIFDLIDLWPETMPLGKVKNLPPFTIWRDLRDKALKYADFVVSECDLYREVLDYALKDIKVGTIYLAKKNIDVVSTPLLSEDEIHLAYLGSINNIIDIPKIKKLITAFGKVRPITLHVVGDGEKKQEFIDEAKSAGAMVEYYNKVYDPQEKQDIFDKCHFGINIMKDTVCVGLTMKSIDYFQHGLPIINNIPADTWKLVEKHDIGINISSDMSDDQLDKALESVKMWEFKDKKEYARKVFEKYFSEKAFTEKLSDLIENLNL